MTDNVQSRKKEEIENVTGKDSSKTGGDGGEVAGNSGKYSVGGP